MEIAKGSHDVPAGEPVFLKQGLPDIPVKSDLLVPEGWSIGRKGVVFYGKENTPLFD